MSQSTRRIRKKKSKIARFISETEPAKLMMGITTIVVILIALITVTVIIVKDVTTDGGITGSKTSSVEKDKLAPVSGLEVTGTTQNSISFKWNKVENAEGYNLYLKPPEAIKFKFIKEIDGGDTNKFTLKDLDAGENYSLYITPYNSKGETQNNYIVESTFTLPTKPSITALKNDADGNVKIAWTPDEKADGFRIDYKDSDEENFTTGNSKNLPGGLDSNVTFTELEKNKEFDFRVCAYIVNNGMKYESQSEVYSISTDPAGNTPDEIVDPSRPMIALTFDDGPGGKVSDRILDILDEYNAKATFFMIGTNVSMFSDNVKRKVSLGMELGNHTMTHRNYGDDVTMEDITDASDLIKRTVGRKPDCFRSPDGITTDNILSMCKKQKLPLYYWTLDSEDTKSKDADRIYDKVVNSVKDGDIILMHEVYDCTADALAKILPELKEKGFQFVTCRQLVISKTGELPVPGTQYRFVKNMDNGSNKKAEEE